MSSKRALNIGVVGYGFMGRTHANAFRQVNQYFDVAYRPQLKAVCGRTEAAVKAFALALREAIALDPRRAKMKAPPSSKGSM